MISVPLVLLVVSWHLHHHSTALRVGDKVPAIALQELQGATYHWPSHLEKPVIINFFATWCPPCQAEAPALAQFAKVNIGSVQLMMVDRKEGPPLVRQFMNTYHLQGVTTLLDQSDQWATLFGVTGQPETIGIDTKGVIRFHQLGPETTALLNSDLAMLKEN
jgi:thiol-disulfide isomerase/thioredoxin